MQLDEIEANATAQALQYITQALNDSSLSTSYHIVSINFFPPPVRIWDNKRIKLHEMKQEKQKEYAILSAQLENRIQNQVRPTTAR